MTTDDHRLVRTRLGSLIDVLRRRLVGAGHAHAAVEFGIIMIVAMFVMVVAVQFAFTGEAAQVAVLANVEGASSTAKDPAASQSAVPAYLAEHIDDAFRA